VVTTHVTIPRAAKLLGIDPATAWRQARAGKYGPITRKNGKGSQLVSAEELQRRTGMVFSEDQLRQATIDKRTLKRAPDRQSSLPVLDLGHIALFIEARDLQWRRYLIGKADKYPDVHNWEGPPVPRSLAPDFATQNLFTRAQVELLIERTIRERDSAWEAWVENPFERAQFPAGPEPLRLSNLTDPRFYPNEKE
jgi:hypothetical protein